MEMKANVLMPRIKKYVLGTNWLKTLRINFHYFPLKKAVRSPILVSNRVVLQRLGGGVEIEGKLTTGMLLLGYHNLGGQDKKGDRTVWQVDGLIKIRGKRIDIGRGSKLSIHGILSLGDHFTITGNTSIICRNNIVFGDDVLISWEVLVMDTDFHTIVNNDGRVLNSDKPIEVSNHVWIGCRCTILKGVRIPPDVVIAAGSIMTGDIEEGRAIYASNQRLLREHINWIR